MEDIMFFHEGEAYSKEAFLAKIGLPEGVYDEMQRKNHGIIKLTHCTIFSSMITIP